MKKHIKIITAALTAVCVVILFYCAHAAGLYANKERDKITVGFMCSGDESTPYSENFLRVRDILQVQFGDRVQIKTCSNVPPESAAVVVDELEEEGCDIIFSTSADYGEAVKKAAESHPNIQYCQAACSNANDEPVLQNYHTFMGAISEGRYVSGKVAGMKLQELIDSGEITSDEAWLGYVGAYACPEVISGYTAFFLGAYSECPDVKMRVRYTETWSSYSREKQTAEQLIDEGCIVISQHSDTTAPAAACENSKQKHPVFHVGYSQDMAQIAPNSSLIGTRIDWSPYICTAVEAVLKNKRIEDMLSCNIYGNDAGAGFKDGWVRMFALNRAIAPQGAETMVNNAIDDIKEGRCNIFKGNFVGIDPDDPNNTWDLNDEYPENKNSSAPTFHYILKDVIVVE